MTANPLVGTRRLVSYEIKRPAGQVDHPFGKDPVGYLAFIQ
jgi:hypothetical protein